MKGRTPGMMEKRRVSAADLQAFVLAIGRKSRGKRPGFERPSLAKVLRMPAERFDRLLRDDEDG